MGSPARVWMRARRRLAPGPPFFRAGASRSGLPVADALLDLVAQVLVHVLPVLEGTLEHRLGHAVEQVACDVTDQALPGRVIEDLAHQGASLAPVAVFGVQDVGAAHDLAVDVP